MHKCINNSIGNVYHLEQFVSEFYPYSQKQLGFNQPATIRFESDEDNAGVMLGKTAYYDPATMEVALYVDGRHPKDVMRSLSHELVHHAQNCRGDFTGQDSTEAGYAQSDPHLRKMEREAYTKGNLIFRDFEDLIKTGKINIEIDFSDSGEPKMSLKEWKNNEINTKLMKKWGLLKEGSPAESENMRGRKTKEIEDVEDEKGLEETCSGVEDEELEEILGRKTGFGSEREKAWRRIARGSDDPARGRSMDKPAGHRDYKPDPSKGEKDYGAAEAEDEELEEILGFDKTQAHGDERAWKRIAQGGTATRPRHHSSVKGHTVAPHTGGMELGDQAYEPSTPEEIAAAEKFKAAKRQENKKISVREAKEITRRIIERIRKEGK